jgi:hypothetical protein
VLDRLAADYRIEAAGLKRKRLNVGSFPLNILNAKSLGNNLSFLDSGMGKVRRNQPIRARAG